MGIEDEDFDMLAGDAGEDEGAADAIAELDTGADEAEAEAELDEGAGGGVDDQAGSDAADADDGEDQEAQDQEQQGGQTVPLAVLLDERKNFQQRMDDLAAKAAKFEAFEARMKEIQAEKDKPAPEPEPEYLDDPKEYVDHKVGKAEERAATAEEKAAKLEEQTQQRAQMEQINNRLNTYDQELMKTTPDYYDALEHVRQINIANIKAMGANDTQAAQQAGQAIFMAQVQAMRQGVDPAKYMYEMAGRFGYSAKPAEDTGKAQDDKDDAIIAGQEAASMGGGAAPDAERDEELDDDEFSEAFNELFGQAPR